MIKSNVIGRKPFARVCRIPCRRYSVPQKRTGISHAVMLIESGQLLSEHSGKTIHVNPDDGSDRLMK